MGDSADDIAAWLRDTGYTPLKDAGNGYGTPVRSLPTDLVESEFLQDGDGARFGIPAKPSLARAWAATARVSTRRGKGSGFVLDREGHIATCAHVIEADREIRVDLPRGGYLMESHSARLVAIDYANDAAILKTKVPLREDMIAMSFGATPLPGTSVIMSGYPSGVTTPRLSPALVSGYDVFDLHGAKIPCPVVEANIHPGNSGGPIVDEDERVVGMIAARPSTLPPPTSHHDEQAAIVSLLKMLLVKDLRIAQGTGFVVGPERIARLLEHAKKLEASTARAHLEWEKSGGREDDPWGPVPEIHASKRAFVQLHAACRRLRVSPMGPFLATSDGWIAEASDTRDLVAGPELGAILRNANLLDEEEEVRVALLGWTLLVENPIYDEFGEAATIVPT